MLSTFIRRLLTVILTAAATRAAAQHNISGCVKDAITLRPLPFATIKTDANGQGVIADLNGNFSIPVKGMATNLSFSYLGYEPVHRNVGTQDDTLLIFLQPAMSSIGEVTITPNNKKIRRILAAAIAHRDGNNPEKQDWYRCNVYYKMLADGIAPDSLIKKDTSKDAREYLAFIASQHLLMSETYSIRSWRKPQQLQEEIIGSRFSGFKKSLFNGLVTDVLPFHAYNDYLKLNGKEYHNPISKGSAQRYYFALTDEILQDNDTIWLLSFHPANSTGELTGKVYISSDNYAITHLIAKAYDSSLKREVRLEQQYAQTNGKWFPKQLNYVFDWQVKQDSTTVLVHMIGTSIIDSVSFTAPITFKFDKVHTVKLRGGADELPEAEWVKLRPIAIDNREQRTYVFMDSLVDNTGIGKYLPYIDKIIEGKIPYSFIDFDLKRLYRNNGFEHHRVGLGIQTNEKLIKWLSVGGWAGYGTGDAHWKWGAFAEFYLDEYKETRLSIRYDHDLRDPGRLDLHPDLNKNFLRGFLMNKADEINTFSIAFKKPVGYWQFRIEAKQEEIKPQYEYSLLNENTYYNTFQTHEVNVTARYAFAERSAPLFGRYYSTGTKYPILYLRCNTGQLESGDAYKTTYIQVLGAVSWQKHLNRIGNERILITGGKSWSEKPLPTSKLFSGNGLRRDDDDNLYSFGALITALPYAYYSDAFAALYFKHDFDWKLYKLHAKRSSFGSAPFISLAHNLLYGTMNNRNAQRGASFSVPNEGYNESGIILNNLIRCEYLGLYYITLNAGYFYHWQGNEFDKKNGSLVFGLGVEL